MHITLENPSSAPAPAASYSQIARVDVGDGALLFVAGQIALDENGKLVGPDDMTKQSEVVMDALSAILKAHGAGWQHVVNIRTFLTDISRIREYGEVRRRYLASAPPTSTTVEVSRLFVPGALLEAEVVAAVPVR
jgi:enamine deaminase RidA (YjgF/YER057c/UK114 family)